MNSFHESRHTHIVSLGSIAVAQTLLCSHFRPITVLGRHAGDTATFEFFENPTDTDPDDTDIPDLVESEPESESESKPESNSSSEANSVSLK